MLSISLVLGVVLLVAAVLGIALIFTSRAFQAADDRETRDFVETVASYRYLLAHYEKMQDESETEKRAARMIPQIVEALNLNTKSLETVEQTLAQLALRQAQMVDRTRERSTQVGEETPTMRVGNMTVVGATRHPTTRTDEGEDGFVDEASGTVVPLTPPTAREIAAMPPT